MSRLKTRRGRKMGNEPQEYKGIRFASRAECRRYQELEMLMLAGEIFDLSVQPRFLLLDKFTHPYYGKVRALNYTSDFRYRLTESPGVIVIEEIKGQMRQAASVRIKLFLSLHPEIDFRLITNKERPDLFDKTWRL